MNRVKRIKEKCPHCKAVWEYDRDTKTGKIVNLESVQGVCEHLEIFNGYLVNRKG